MSLRPGRAEDEGAVLSIWQRPANAPFLTPPEPGQVARSIEAGDLLVWDDRGIRGFALLVEWLPGVMGIEAMATDSPGHGIGTALLRATLTHVFHTRGAHRLGLDTTVDNAAALALYAKIGFTREGTWRECWRRPSGDWVDCAFLSMLAREWT